MRPILLKIFFFILCSFMGLLFLYSGYTKLYPIEPFEYTFVDIGIVGWRLAPFVARFMISLEFFIGFLLILGLYVKKISIKLTIASLVVFSIYLIIIILKTGNNGNCGCFGTAIVMTPLQALIKNAIMLVACFFIWKFYDGFNFGKIGKWLFGTTFLVAFALPHILNYVDLNYYKSYLTKRDEHFKLELDSLYRNAKIYSPPKTLSTGKHIIAFMSMTCPHCRIAAKKLRIIKERNPKLSVYLVLNGEYKMIQPFFEDTKARNINYCVLNGKNFIYLAGLQMPTLYLVNNSIVENQLNYIEFDQIEIEKWFSKP